MPLLPCRINYYSEWPAKAGLRTDQPQCPRRSQEGFFPALCAPLLVLRLVGGGAGMRVASLPG